MFSILTRTDFRDTVLARDGHACVICGARDAKLDAHHIIDRALWRDGGYHLANGATLCDRGTDGCHWRAETTEISVEEIRRAAGIVEVLLPEDLTPDETYDKWGNIVLRDGRRLRGPMFETEQVQRVLKPILDRFGEHVKYPRTPHAPWSLGRSPDDVGIPDMSAFHGQRVIVTRKMDGETFSGYRGSCHARSIDGMSHPSRDAAKAIWFERCWDLPEGWRITGENLYARHSIGYSDLPGYLLGISIWNEANRCLTWDDTVTWFQLLDLPVVEVLYDGIYDEAAIRALHVPSRDDAAHEGYVVRVADSFAYPAFGRSVMKYVRERHVTTSDHWMHGEITPNGLALQGGC